MYATQSNLGGTAGTGPASSRKAITPISDDGRYRWNELSAGEKVARSTQQSVNFFVVCLGAVMTVSLVRAESKPSQLTLFQGGVTYFLYSELFSADSKTRQFNHAVDRIKDDPRCTDLLGRAGKIKAYGEPTSNKWARARPIAHQYETDRAGTVHLRMHFNVSESPVHGNLRLLKIARRSRDL